MKTQKLLITIVLLLSFQPFVKAQEIPIDIVERVAYCNYIFEGEVIRSDAYFSQDKKYIYTSSTIQIYKLIKTQGTGKFDCGTVEIITDGGTVRDTTLKISHNLELKKGMKGIFLCNETRKELPSVDFYPESNSVKLEVPYGNEGYIKYFEDGINRRVVDWQFQFDSLSQVYNLLQFTTGMTIVDCFGGNKPILSPPKPLKYIPLHQETNSIESRIVSVNNTQVNTILNVDFGNRHITGTNPPWYEFDILLGDDIDTGAYFGTVDIGIKFPTSIFGSHVVDSNRVSTSLVGMFANAPYHILLIDSASNLFILRLSRNNHPLSSPLINIPNTPTRAVRVAIQIQDCNFNGTITQQSVYPHYQNQGYNTTALPGIDTVVNYTNLDLASPVYFEPCNTLHIDRIYPHVVNGGVGDTVTVEGMNFDTTRGTGNIYLRNAHDNVSYLALDSADIFLWNDTLIKFIMPGDIRNPIYYISGQIGVPGSGFLRLKNSNLDTTQADSITVWYSVTAPYDSVAGSKQLYNLGNIYSTDTGYTFRIDTALSQATHPDRWNTIDVAIKQWVCLSHVNYILGDTLTPPDSLAKTDRKNMIQFGKLTSLSTVMQTYQWPISTLVGCSNVVIPEVDIIINRDLKDSIFWDTNCSDSIPPRMRDGYHAILHELGHAHSLNHVNDHWHIMYWGDKISNQIIPGWQRNILIKGDYSARDGGIHVMQQAGLLSGCPQVYYLGQRTYPGCNLLPGRMASTVCDGITIGINEIQSDLIGFNVYPNPANGNLNLEFTCESPHSGIVSVFNMLGERLMERGDKFVVGQNFLTLDVSKISAGMYIIQVDSKSGRVQTKFLKQE